MRVTNPGHEGRPYRTLRKQVLDEDPDWCAICGHWGGANEIDHIRALKEGGDPLDRDNVRRAHGSSSPCVQCPRTPSGRYRSCNQTRHWPQSRAVVGTGVTSRRW